ncbi:MAG TPA: AmmeMemoRadiSam system radical SAM enzyme [bacterium]|nr:AmmeMemoRadiSam system radical SAM enzyme [bacterium]
MKESMFQESAEGGKARCYLCNHFCVLKEGEIGICGVRVNRGGKIFSLIYGKLVAESVDPIEKKPFFHFLPGSLSYSIAGAGCNFSCVFCQNYPISQSVKKDAIPGGSPYTPEQVVTSASVSGCKSISYTYTEPTMFFEFAFETAKLAKEKGLMNNFVTNGYMSVEALKLISPHLDAANVDLKGDENFYRKLCGAKRKPVLDNIKLMKELGIWVEVTTLLIPGYNDSTDQINELAEIIRDIDISIPWHISRFFPVYKMNNHYPTPVEKINEARKIGLAKGIKYVYTGNLLGDEGENTFCNSCTSVIVRRYGFQVTENKIKNKKCGVCGAPVDGIF